MVEVDYSAYIDEAVADTAEADGCIKVDVVGNSSKADMVRGNNSAHVAGGSTSADVAGGSIRADVERKWGI